MRIGAYQFAVSGEIEKNMEMIEKAIYQASKNKIRLLIFPECALSGYPPLDMENASDTDMTKIRLGLERIQFLADKTNIHIVIGTITKDDEKYYDSAVVFKPKETAVTYHKRALWGWDQENFEIGKRRGVFEIDGLKIGVRICFEVRFPEYFRELYRQHTDLNIILFYDVSACEDLERYDLIKAHIKTRAVENVCYILSVNTIRPYQTAPTGLFDKSGRTLAELERNKEGLLLYDLTNPEADFGEQGRIHISNQLQQIR